MAVHLINGDVESLVLHAADVLVGELAGDGDRDLMVDDFDSAEYSLDAVIDAAQTPPFLTDVRIVVARGIGRFTADEVAPLVRYLDDPMPTSHVVLVAGGGRTAKALTDAAKRAATSVIDSAPANRKGERAAWFDQQVEASRMRFDHAALDTLREWLGDDLGRLQGVLDTLASAHGSTHVLHVDDVTPFLGDAGGVPPWDLTDAIDAGQTARALELLHRMLHGGDRHPLVVMAILHAHYAKLLVLDGVGARDEVAAAAAMGIKPGYPARKAMKVHAELGADRVGRAIRLLAQADLDLRGAKDWDPELVVEILVARLSRLRR